MFDRKAVFHDLGRPVYGLAAIALGLIGLVWHDFAGWCGNAINLALAAAAWIIADSI